MDTLPHPSPLLKTVDAAAYLCLARGTLERWRTTGTGPSYVKCGDAVRYRLDVLDAYIKDSTVETA